MKKTAYAVTLFYSLHFTCFLFGRQDVAAYHSFFRVLLKTDGAVLWHCTDITSGMYNIAAGNIMITAERADSVNFSDAYYTADAVAVVRSEAALALGYSENQAFFRFIFPQVAVRFLPVYKQEIVSLLKSTSIVGYIAIQD